MDKTEFIQLEEFEQHQDIDPDVIIENTKKQNDSNLALANQKAEQDLLDELGI